jgi:ATP-dependent DNA ligase
MSASRELHRQVRRIEPCLPRAAKQPPAGPGWIHEIKHDGYRIMAERDHGSVKLYTRNGYDFADRFPLAAAAIRKLPMRSCLIDGEAIVCDANGLAVFDGEDLRRVPIEERKATLAKSPTTSITAATERSSTSTPARSVARASCRSVLDPRTAPAVWSVG